MRGFVCVRVQCIEGGEGGGGAKIFVETWFNGIIVSFFRF